MKAERERTGRGRREREREIVTETLMADLSKRIHLLTPWSRVLLEKLTSFRS
jgi:hypothetical protein